MVLHYTEMARCDEALARLCDPKTEVSAHYLISEQGRIWRLVDEERRAWHAGAGSWAGRGDVNSRSIGIELSNTGLAPFAAPLMTALEGLLSDILARWDIAPENVIAHSDMAPSRKPDPGPRFDWRRLAVAGLSVWPEAEEAEPGTFRAQATRFGYPGEENPEEVLKAFRWRFRPWARGPLDRVDAGLAANLARRFAVDRGGDTP